jgi:DNA-binding transcriptional ArsR family regulator
MKNKITMNEAVTGTESADYAAECAVLNLRKASRFITGLYDEYIRPSGLRATQLTLLMALHQAGPVTITALSEILLMDRTTLTRDLKPLERQGLVSRDRRGRPQETVYCDHGTRPGDA